MQIHQLKLLPTMAFVICCLTYAIDTRAQITEKLESFRTATHYTRGLAGFAGHQFEADIIFESILATEDAESIFLETIQSKNSTPASIAYSFCGLKKLNSKKIFKIKEQLSLSNTEVSQMNGDVMKKEALSKLISKIYNHGC